MMQTAVNDRLGIERHGLRQRVHLVVQHRDRHADMRKQCCKEMGDSPRAATDLQTTRDLTVYKKWQSVLNLSVMDLQCLSGLAIAIVLEPHKTQQQLN